LGVIRSSGQFASWDQDALARLAQHFDEVRVRAGERIASDGALCHQLLVVAEGRLETFSSSRRGALGPGDTFGWSAMVARGRNEATVLAATDARLLVMSHAQFRAALAPPPRRRFPRWALPSSRWSLPRQPTLARSVEAKNPGANPAC